MPNPQPLEPTYNYLNADIAALSAVIGGGASNEDFLIQQAVFTDTNTAENFVYATTPPDKDKSLFRFGINIPKTYNLNGTEALKIYIVTSQGETNIVKCLLVEIIEIDSISGTCLNYISDIQNLSVNAVVPETLNVEITNITAGGDILFSVGFSSNPFYADRTQEVLNRLQTILISTQDVFNVSTDIDQNTRPIKATGNDTRVDIVTAANAANLVININALLSGGLINNVIRNISYSIDGVQHQALITYLI
jgi:hypothetical protein